MGPGRHCSNDDQSEKENAVLYLIRLRLGRMQELLRRLAVVTLLISVAGQRIFSGRHYVYVYAFFCL